MNKNKSTVEVEGFLKSVKDYQPIVPGSLANYSVCTFAMFFASTTNEIIKINSIK